MLFTYPGSWPSTKHLLKLSSTVHLLLSILLGCQAMSSLFGGQECSGQLCCLPGTPESFRKGHLGRLDCLDCPCPLNGEDMATEWNRKIHLLGDRIFSNTQSGLLAVVCAVLPYCKNSQQSCGSLMNWKRTHCACHATKNALTYK